jgi:hypothetical protein
VLLHADDSLSWVKVEQCHQLVCYELQLNARHMFAQMFPIQGNLQEQKGMNLFEILKACPETEQI